VRAAREAFVQEVQRLDPEDLVFVDESGVDTRMVRRYARAHHSERARGHAPFGSYKRLTLLGALCSEGLLAPMSTTAATDTAVFLAYLDQVLIPELVQRKPNAVVIMDNLKPHLVPEVREKLEAAGLRLLYLPPYSPDLSPIEPAWSKLKAILRRVAARTQEALEGALAAAFDAITPQDALGYFAHCGYDLAAN
jgi:transposase